MSLIKENELFQKKANIQEYVYQQLDMDYQVLDDKNKKLNTELVQVKNEVRELLENNEKLK